MDISAQTIKEGMKRVRPDDVKKVLKNKRKIRGKASKGLFRNMLDDVKQMISLVGDYYRGDYPYVPWFSISAILVALLWILNPADLIPDGLPLAGMLDDIVITSLVLAMTEQDLREHARWKKEQEQAEKEEQDKPEDNKTDS